MSVSVAPTPQPDSPHHSATPMPDNRFPSFQLDRSTLRQLMMDRSTNRLHHFPGALPSSYCGTAVEATNTLNFAAYEKTDGSADYTPILKHGPTVFDYAGGEDFDGYFAAAYADAGRGSRSFAAAGIANPQSIALRALRNAWDGEVHIATEPNRVTGNSVPYFAGVIRDIAGGALPHVDDATTETPQLAIGSVIAQASLLFYLQVPTEGGGLRVYDKTATDDDWANMRGYGFSPNSVAGRTFTGVTPTVGSAVLFRTTQIHSVDAVVGSGRRVTWSTFLGLTTAGDLILWS